MNTSRGNYRMTPNSFPGSSSWRRMPRAAAQFNIYEATFPRALRPWRLLEKYHTMKTKWFAGFYPTHMHTHTGMYTCIHMQTQRLIFDPSSAWLLGRQRAEWWGASYHEPPEPEEPGRSCLYRLASDPCSEGVQPFQQTSDYLYSRHTARFKITTQKHPPQKKEWTHE